MMTLSTAEWITDNADLLLGLVLIGLAFAIVLVLRIAEESKRVGVIRAVLADDPAEPPVDEWSAELENGAA